MIDIGSIAYGPELGRRPILTELERLSQSLRAGPLPSPSIELAFEIPGSLGGPDGGAFRLAARRGPEARPIVYIPVPTTVAATDDPLADLVGLAATGISTAANAGRMTLDDRDVLLDELHAAARSLGVAARRSPSIPDAVVTEPSGGSVVSVTVVVLDPPAVDAAFALEAAVVEAVNASGVGAVDGNDVGAGTFTIFVETTEVEAVESLIDDVIKRHWRGRPPRIDVREAAP